MEEERIQSGSGWRGRFQDQNRVQNQKQQQQQQRRDHGLQPRDGMGEQDGRDQGRDQL